MILTNPLSRCDYDDFCNYDGDSDCVYDGLGFEPHRVSGILALAMANISKSIGANRTRDVLWSTLGMIGEFPKLKDFHLVYDVMCFDRAMRKSRPFSSDMAIELQACIIADQHFKDRRIP